MGILERSGVSASRILQFTGMMASNSHLQVSQKYGRGIVTGAVLFLQTLKHAICFLTSASATWLLLAWGRRTPLGLKYYIRMG